MAWDANHILWAEQVQLLWATLPPVFVISGLLAFAAPILYKNEKTSERPHAPSTLHTSNADRAA